MTQGTARPASHTDCASHGASPSFALGLGLTNECNLACSFCYRDPGRIDRLSLEQVQSLMATVPVRSVNLGTGENGMHPEFRHILAWLRLQPVKLTMTSNGYSSARLADEELRAFDDVEFSVDYPTRLEQDRQRGAGNWALIHEQAARCRSLGVAVTFIAVMMKSNFKKLAAVARVASPFQAPLRVNVYQAVRSDLHALTYEEYWEGFRALFGEADVISIGEPLVRAMAGLPARTSGCGRSTIRLTPRATIQPCVYWPGIGEPLSRLLSVGAGVFETQPFADARSVPDACRSCNYLGSCGGGCAGRRRLQNALDLPDVYCPVVRGDHQVLQIRTAPGREFAKSESSCTTMVIARH